MSCEDNTCGTGGWAGPKPGDPSNNVTLSANAVFGGIRVSWSYPTVNPYAVAHTVLYRGSTADFSASIEVGVVSGSIYFDSIDGNQPIKYYYWIRLVSINGTLNDIIGPASATSRPRVQDTLESLTGRIDAGVLAQALKAEIASIQSFGLDLLKEIDDRIASNKTLANALAAVQSETGEALTFVQQEIIRRTEADSALVATINAISAGVAGNTAAIIEERTVRTTKDEALASLLTILTTKTDTNTAAILNESTVRTSQFNSLASTIGTVSTKTDQNAAAIQTEVTARTNAVSAVASNVTTLFSRVGAADAAIRDEAITRASQDAAISGRITTAESNLNGNIAQVQTNLTTNINTVNGKVTQIGALYTAKVNVNGLIGGFGVYNDGTSVEAGFDVDLFWIGRTNANKVKPFIISDGIVYMDKARIRDADIDTLKIAGNAVIINVFAQGGANIPSGGNVFITQVSLAMPTSNSGVVLIATMTGASTSPSALRGRIDRYDHSTGATVTIGVGAIGVPPGYVNCLTFSLFDAPPSGVYTYKLYGYTNGGDGAITNNTSTLIATGAKR